MLAAFLGGFVGAITAITSYIVLSEFRRKRNNKILTEAVAERLNKLSQDELCGETDYKWN